MSEKKEYVAVEAPNGLTYVGEYISIAQNATELWHVVSVPTIPVCGTMGTIEKVEKHYIRAYRAGVNEGCILRGIYRIPPTCMLIELGENILELSEEDKREQDSHWPWDICALLVQGFLPP